MTFKVNIKKTEEGYTYYNADNNKVIGRVIIDRGYNDKFGWMTDFDSNYNCDLEKCHNQIQCNIFKILNRLGIDVEFIFV